MLLSIVDELREHKLNGVWEKLKNCAIPVVLYGTGNGAEKVLKQCQKHNISVESIFASDDFVRDQIFQGYKIERLEDIESRFSDFIIVVSFGSHLQSVLDKIILLSKKHKLLIPDIPVIGENIFTPDFFLSHYDKFKKVWELLCDEQSKKVYEDMIRYKITGDLFFLESSSTTSEEAYKNILKLGCDESFADLGAYKGDTIEEFLKVVSSGQDMQNGYDYFYKSIIAMEPDAKNYSKLCKCVDDLKLGKIRCMQSAVGDCDGMISFDTSGGRQSKVQTKELAKNMPTLIKHKSGSWAEAKANRAAKYKEIAERKHHTTIPVYKLDSLVNEDGISFINMDVEGEEKRALAGCLKTILMYKPKLLVAAYHRTEDLYAIPLQIYAMRKDYQFYFRKYSCFPAWDINFYCI